MARTLAETLATQQTARHALEEYLKEKGLTPQNQKDIAFASEKAREYEIDVQNINQGISRFELKIQSLNSSDIKNIRRIYEKSIKDQIDKLNLSLKNLSEHVKEIELRFEFNIEACKRGAFSDFLNRFQITPSAIGTKEETLYDSLMSGEINEAILLDDLIESIQPRASKKPSNRAQDFLVKFFQNEHNFELFSLILKKHFNSAHVYNTIQVYYDRKPLTDSSFGQRCTAALVLLLKLGNNPIIIDEPEGHLDSLVIADYLVSLIKDIKNHRQVIFATHNANIVVNGDADLILHLEIDQETGLSKITPIVLEDAEERHRILALEGGKAAFKKRESKYLIQ